MADDDEGDLNIGINFDVVLVGAKRFPLWLDDALRPSAIWVRDASPLAAPGLFEESFGGNCKLSNMGLDPKVNADWLDDALEILAICGQVTSPLDSVMFEVSFGGNCKLVKLATDREANASKCRFCEVSLILFAWEQFNADLPKRNGFRIARSVELLLKSKVGCLLGPNVVAKLENVLTNGSLVVADMRWTVITSSFLWTFNLDGATTGLAKLNWRDVEVDVADCVVELLNAWEAADPTSCWL